MPLEPVVETDCEEGCEDPADSRQRDVHAHVLPVAVRRREVVVAEVPCEHAAGEAHAEHRRGEAVEREALEPRGDEEERRRDHEAPAVDRAELDDVHAAEQPRPERDDERHRREGDDRGDEDPFEVGDAKTVLERDRQRRRDHEVAESEDEHPRHEAAIGAILAKHRDHRHRAEGRTLLATPVAFGAGEPSLPAQPHAAIDRVADEAERRGGGIHDQERRRREVEGLADREAGRGEHDRLHRGHLAGDAGTIGVRIVRPPDRGAQRDDAAPEDSGKDRRDREDREPRHALRAETEQQHHRRGRDLQRRDEGDLRAPVGEARPEEARDVRHRGRRGHRRHGEVEFRGRDLRQRREVLLDDDAHRAALDRAEHDRQERPAQQFAGVVRPQHRRQGARVETRDEASDSRHARPGRSVGVVVAAGDRSADSPALASTRSSVGSR